MLSWPNLRCNLGWNVCDRNFSPPTWITMWIRSDDKGWCHDVIWGALWIETDSGILLWLPNMKCYLDWKICDRKLSRPIWYTMWIRSDDGGWCHDLIWGDMWIGEYDKGCSLHQF
jgi:hypothetical protein